MPMHGRGNTPGTARGEEGSRPQKHDHTLREALHPAWAELIAYCRELQFGELEKLKIQNGVPMMAELTTRKVRFGS